MGRTANLVSITCATRAWRIGPRIQVQRGYYFAIVDEIDSILIDEARTPLIISAARRLIPPRTSSAQLQPMADRLVKRQRELCNKIIEEAKRSCWRRARRWESRLQAVPGQPGHAQTHAAAARARGSRGPQDFRKSRRADAARRPARMKPASCARNCSSSSTKRAPRLT